MARLIDADAVMNRLNDATGGLEEEFPTDEQVKPFMCGVRLATCFIGTAPTIDAEPVVRCKDCKCWTEWDNGTGSCSRFALDWLGTDADDFCSMGERKDND